jgi:hypothetical protein
MSYFTFAVYRETALFYAISAAALTHVVARACAEGTMRLCRCADNSNPEDTARLWRSGTCGDNYNFGRRFTRRFAQLRHKRMDQLHGSLVRHNMIVGIQVRLRCCYIHKKESVTGAITHLISSYWVSSHVINILLRILIPPQHKRPDILVPILRKISSGYSNTLYDLKIHVNLSI